MKRVILAIAVAGATLVACSESNSPETAQTPTGPSFAPAPPDPCKVAQSYTNAFLSLASDRKAVNDALKAAQGLARGTDRNTQVYNAFLAIEVARDANPIRIITTDAGLTAGGNLVFNAIACGDFVVSETHDAAYWKSVLSANGAWAFVQGTDAAFVQTLDGEAAADPAEGGTWADWIPAPRGVVFAAEVLANFNENHPEIFQKVYQWGVIVDSPGPTVESGEAIIELCPLNTTNGPNWYVGRQRDGGETVLETGEIAGFCDVAPSSTLGNKGSQSFLARAFQSAISLFRPTPLEAALVVAPPGVGGSSGSGLLGFSEYALVIPSGLVVTITTTIPNGFVNVPFAVQACAATPAPNNTPIEDVAITLTIDGNQGTTVVLSGGGPQDTDETGCTTFNASINKTGGYTLRATGSFAVFSAFDLSNLFNLQQ